MNNWMPVFKLGMELDALRRKYWDIEDEKNQPGRTSEEIVGMATEQANICMAIGGLILDR